MTSHSFDLVSFASPQWCNVCLKFCWGVGKKVNKCRDCDFIAHRRCASTAPRNCSRIDSPSTGKRPLRRHQSSLRDISDLARVLAKPTAGLAIRDRKVKLKVARASVPGSELIDWMMVNLPIRTRDEAVTVAQKLIDERYMFDALDAKRTAFHDDRSSYYRLSDDATEAASSSADAGSSRSSSSAARSSSSDVGEEERVSLSSFKLIKVVGKGGFGKVLKVMKKDSGKVFAMKVMDKSMFVSERHIRSLLAERNIMVNACPFLVHLFFSFQTTDKLYFVMDFIAGGDLAYYFDRMGRFPEQLTRFWGAEISLALEYLHGCGVVYRDLKPENILIDAQGHIVLTDFGLSKELSGSETSTSTLCGTPAYLAPEIIATLDGATYDGRCDLWSLGVVLYEMTTGCNPFEGGQLDEVMARVRTLTLEYPADVFSPAAADFVASLIVRDPELRAGYAAIRSHPWFTSLDWNDLGVKKVESPFIVAQGENFDQQTESVASVIKEQRRKGSKGKGNGKGKGKDAHIIKGLEFTSPRLLS
uniref:protein kinase C n=1 Tax=Sexangularia sp. CB-2014 TaxID=1486929 RepID=A0A7S1YC24_9EUKA|mmetsp:Transcript_13015/g.41068  ORF Transcript_13015/g.41068 Transcript_13015/m.41068 type:complete len:531 (+) Transcript_13015:44-1636(+)